MKFNNGEGKSKSFLKKKFLQLSIWTLTGLLILSLVFAPVSDGFWGAEVALAQLVPTDIWGSVSLDDGGDLVGHQTGDIPDTDGLVPTGISGTISLEEPTPPLQPQARSLPVSQPINISVSQPSSQVPSSSSSSTNVNPTFNVSPSASANSQSSATANANSANNIDVRQSQGQSQSSNSSSSSSTGPISINTGGGAPQVVSVPVPVQSVPVTQIVPVVSRVPVAQTVPVVQTVPQKTPVVTTPTSIGASELPRTGPADFAWFLSGLIPLGWRLKKFGADRLEKMGSGEHLWQKREYEKNS